MSIMALEVLERMATKHGSAMTTIAGEEFEVKRMVKSKRRRYGYRHGNRFMARDEALPLFKTTHIKDVTA